MWPLVLIGALILGFTSGGIWGAIGAVVLTILATFLFAALVDSIPKEIKIGGLVLLGIWIVYMILKWILNLSQDDLISLAFFILFLAGIGGISYYTQKQKEKGHREKVPTAK